MERLCFVCHIHQHKLDKYEQINSLLVDWSSIFHVWGKVCMELHKMVAQSYILITRYYWHKKLFVGNFMVELIWNVWPYCDFGDVIVGGHFLSEATRLIFTLVLIDFGWMGFPSNMWHFTFHCILFSIPCDVRIFFSRKRESLRDTSFVNFVP